MGKKGRLLGVKTLQLQLADVIVFVYSATVEMWTRKLERCHSSGPEEV